MPLPDNVGTITFSGKHPEEGFRFYFRQHWIRLVWPSLRVLLYTAVTILSLTVLFGIAGIDDPGMRHFLFLLIITFFVASHIVFLARFYRYFLYVIILTDRRVHRIKRTLLAFDDHQSIDLAAIQDIHKFQHGVIQNVFGFGSIILEAQETHLRIHFIPRIARVYEQILHLHREVRTDVRADALMLRP